MTGFLGNLKLSKLLKLRIGPRKEDFAGIDIGSESVKAVELERAGGGPLLKTYGELKSAQYFQNTPTFTTGGLIGYSDQNVVELIRDLMEEAGIKTTQVVIGIPSSASFVTTVSLPMIHAREIESAIPFEAKKYIPIPVNEVALDWQVLSIDQSAKRSTVLLAAVPQEVIAKFRRIAEALGLDLVAVEIESFALVRALLGRDRGAAAILNIGAYISTLTVAHAGAVRANHNFGRGSREITMMLSQSLGVSQERAEELKREVGLSDRPEERGAMETIAPLIDSLLGEVERAMVAFNRTSEAKIEKIILVGGSAPMAGLTNYVSQRFGLETSIGNPFSTVAHPAFLDQILREIGPNFSVAVGLALRQLTTPPAK